MNYLLRTREPAFCFHSFYLDRTVCRLFVLLCLQRPAGHTSTHRTRARRSVVLALTCWGVGGGGQFREQTNVQTQVIEKLNHFRSGLSLIYLVVELSAVCVKSFMITCGFL